MKLLDSVRELKNSRARGLVEARLREFREVGKSQKDRLFQELCFCLLTANYSAEGGLRIEKAMGREFCTLSEKGLARRLRELGHRYPNARAGYIFRARGQRQRIADIIKSGSGEGARAWLVENVRGLGWKEASHFLRNLGFRGLAIIDFHILDLLAGEGLIERPRTLTKRKYLEIEGILKGLARKAGMSMAELDLYLWYLETGKILK